MEYAINVFKICILVINSANIVRSFVKNVIKIVVLNVNKEHTYIKEAIVFHVLLYAILVKKSLRIAYNVLQDIRLMRIIIVYLRLGL